MDKKQDINLISKVVRQSFKLVQLKRKINIFTTIFLALFAFFLLGVLGFLVLGQRNFRHNQSKITSLKAQVQAFQKTESYALTIADRLKKIDTILKKRASFVGPLSDVELIVIPGFSLTYLKISSQGDIQISGVCLNSGLLADFRNQLEQIRQRGKYSQLIYSSVQRKEDGSFELALQLKK